MTLPVAIVVALLAHPLANLPVTAREESAQAPAIAQRTDCQNVLGSPSPALISGERPPPQAHHGLDDPFESFWRVPLGVGHLRPEESSFWPHDRPWGFPLYAAPQGRQIAWIYNGWLVDDRGQTPLGSEGMVETSYEGMSFLVLQHRADGWLHVRYRRERDRRGHGTAWVHVCHLGLTETRLAFQRWEDLFLSETISPLYFRAAVVHALREHPGTGARRLTWIGANHHLEPVEIRGDWMKVILKQPSDYCVDPTTAPVRGQVGWVQWRSADRGPWVWYYARGC